MRKKELVDLLGRDDFAEVYREADQIRQSKVGDIVHIRGIIEFSNICGRNCAYCGINRENRRISRYQMSAGEILQTAQKGVEAGYKTIVLQSGENPDADWDLLGEIIKKIKEMKVAVTISCGELQYDVLEYLKRCGADRYLLKHETADAKLYAKLHPGHRLKERVKCLKNIKKLGYETGGGFMVGLPGQTLETIADDLLLLRELGCNMAGIGPFIPHPDTPLGESPTGSTELTKRAVALARILLPWANLPVTTSLGVIDQQEKENAFSCGANVIMRKLTPEVYKRAYEIYPAELGETHIAEERAQLETQIKGLGRSPL